MNHIIENIKAVLHLDSTKDGHTTDDSQHITECNYDNNYYGDQQCQLKVLDK